MAGEEDKVKFPFGMGIAEVIKGEDWFLMADENGEALASQWNKAKEFLNITGIELEPLVGGDTSGTALVVSPGPSGEQRTAEVASGKYYDFGSGPQLADADKRWKAYWSGSSWSLKDMGALPTSQKEEETPDILINVKDSEDNQLGFWDKHGNFWTKFKKSSIPTEAVSNLDESLKNVPKENTSENMIMTFQDPTGNVLAYFNKKGRFVNDGLDQHIVDLINGFDYGSFEKLSNLSATDSLEFPEVRVKDGYLYRVKQGATADAGSLPLTTNTPFEEINPSGREILGYKNRLANSDLRTYENSTSQVTKEVVFNAEEIPSRPYSRIPSCIITYPAFSVLSACEKRELTDDYGFMDLMVKRKTNGGASWNTVLHIETNAATTYKRYMNPSFVVDRQGKHGPANRIYLFVTAFLTEVGFANTLNNADADLLYFTSDDDGQNWSSPISIKSSFNTAKAKFHLVSPTNGIQLTDGTLVFPSFAVVAGDSYYRGSLFYKKPGGAWTFSELGDWYGENESVVYESTTPNEVILNTRGWMANALRGEYKLNWSNNVLEPTPNHLQFRAGINCQMSITKGTVGGKSMYLMTFPDSPYTNTSVNVGDRRNPTVWGSLDGKRWLRLYRLAKIMTTNGYSVASVVNGGRIVVIYELVNGVIEMQELTQLAPTFAKHMETQYVMTAEDKIQYLINNLLD